MAIPDDQHGPDHHRPLDRYDLLPPAVPQIPPPRDEPADRRHPDFLAACEDAHVLPERCFFTARTDERTTARRAVACRLLDKGWRPGRIARLLGIHYCRVWVYAHQCPPLLNKRAWRPPAHTYNTPYGRKLRRAREQKER